MFITSIHLHVQITSKCFWEGEVLLFSWKDLAWVWKGVEVCLNFEPSRSDRRRMNKLQGKSHQLGMERMWRLAVQAGQGSHTKDRSLLHNSSWDYFLTYHIGRFSSLGEQSVGVLWLMALEWRDAGPGQLLPDSFFGHKQMWRSDSHFNSYSCCLTSSLTLRLLPVSSHDLLAIHWLKRGQW